jgi:hypothetical protein
MLGVYLAMAVMLLIEPALSKSIERARDKREDYFSLQIRKFQCIGSRIELSCVKNAKIYINSANYGRTSASRCSASDEIDDSDDICINDYTAIFEDECEGRSSCLVDVSKHNTGTDCNHVRDPYIEVDFVCSNHPVF